MKKLTAFTGVIALSTVLGATDLVQAGEGTGGQCDNLADINQDGVLDIQDVLEFIDLFLAGDPAVDFDGCGCVDLVDVTIFIQAFIAGCP